MATFNTNTTLISDTNAHFQSWVNEIYTGLVTQCGLTQTADTGQMAVPCTTALPGAGSTKAGYYVFRFNDALQATSPIFFRIDFGSGASATIPEIWMTLGSSSNGAGTIGGATVTGSWQLGWGQFTGDGVTNFPSYYCYNATQGFCGMAFKIGTAGNNNTSVFGFAVFRTVDNTGAPTADGCMFLNNNNTTVATSSSGKLAALNFNTGELYADSGVMPNGAFWTATMPFLSTHTTKGTAQTLGPVWQYKGNATTPGFGITNALAFSVPGDNPYFSTITATILGSTNLTYICVGPIWGYTNIGGGGNFNNLTGVLCMLYQ